MNLDLLQQTLQVEGKVLKTLADTQILEKRNSGGTIVISTGGLDRDKDRVMPSGMSAENYKKNPVVLWGHNSREFWATIGKTKGLTKKKEKIEAKFVLRPAVTEADPQMIILALWNEEWIRAASIGFRPLGYGPEFIQPNDFGGLDFLGWELLEWSLVPIPANQDAIRLSLSPQQFSNKYVSEIQRLIKADRLSSGNVKDLLERGDIFMGGQVFTKEDAKPEEEILIADVSEEDSPEKETSIDAKKYGVSVRTLEVVGYSGPQKVLVSSIVADIWVPDNAEMVLMDDAGNVSVSPADKANSEVKLKIINFNPPIVIPGEKEENNLLNIVCSGDLEDLEAITPKLEQDYRVKSLSEVISQLSIEKPVIKWSPLYSLPRITTQIIRQLAIQAKALDSNLDEMYNEVVKLKNSNVKRLQVTVSNLANLLDSSVVQNMGSDDVANLIAAKNAVEEVLSLDNERITQGNTRSALLGELDAAQINSAMTLITDAAAQLNSFLGNSLDEYVRLRWLSASAIQKISYEKVGLIPEYAVWNGTQAKKRVLDWSGGDKPDYDKFGKAFSFVAGPKDLTTSYKGIHHDVVDGELVTNFKGVASAMANLVFITGPKMKTNNEKESARAVYNHLTSHYKDYGIQGPEWKDIVYFWEIGDEISSDILRNLVVSIFRIEATSKNIKGKGLTTEQEASLRRVKSIVDGILNTVPDGSSVSVVRAFLDSKSGGASNADGNLVDILSEIDGLSDEEVEELFNSL